MNNSNLSPEELVTTLEQLRTEFRSLQWSYQKLEDDYRILQIQVKRGKRLRRWWLVLIITAGVATGWYLRSEDILTYLEQRGLLVTASSASPTPAASKFIKVEQRSLSVTLPNLMGKIEPLKQVEIVSPVAGKVKAKHFEYNQMVKNGQTLLVIDTTDEERNYRSAQAESIEAKNELEKLRHWQSSQEVKTAQRQLTDAQHDLAVAKRKLEESRGLLQKGIVPSSEVEEGEETVRGKELAYQSAQEGLESVLKEGSEDKIKVAELKMEVARSKMLEVQTRIAQANVVSPMAGVVFLPPQSNSASSEQQATLEIQEGSVVKQDQRLLMVANFDGFIVTAKVEEIHILKLAPGQPVTIKGEAFPQVTLEGVIKDISSQADPDQQGSTDQVISKFSVTIAVSKLTAEQKKHLRLGMSTEMEVILSKKDKSLVVPFEAVTIKDKEAWVTVLDKQTGQPKEVKVKLGQTLVDGALEIVEGIQADDKLLPRLVEPDKEKEEGEEEGEGAG